MPFTACHTHHQPHPATTHAHAHAYAYAYAYAHRTEPGSRCTQTHDTPQRKPARPRQSNENAPTNNTTQKNKSIQTIRTNTTDNPPPHPHRPNKRHKRHKLHKRVGTARSCQMLASTIQISNNNPTPTTHTPLRRMATGRAATVTVHGSRFTRTAARYRSQVPKPQTPPRTQNPLHRGAPRSGGGLILQNPNSVSVDIATPQQPTTPALTSRSSRRYGRRRSGLFPQFQQAPAATTRPGRHSAGRG
jgi:hypothetical protein